MLDIRFIKEHLEQVKKNITDRNMVADADLVVKLYDEKTALQQKLDSLRQQRNERENNPLRIRPHAKNVTSVCLSFLSPLWIRAARQPIHRDASICQINQNKPFGCQFGRKFGRNRIVFPAGRHIFARLRRKRIENLKVGTSTKSILVFNEPGMADPDIWPDCRARVVIGIGYESFEELKVLL